MIASTLSMRRFTHSSGATMPAGKKLRLSNGEISEEAYANHVAKLATFDRR